MLDRQRALFEEFFQKCIVAFGHQFYKSLVRLLCDLREVAGDLAFLPFAVSVRSVRERLHPDKVNDTLELPLRSNRQLYRHRGPAEYRLNTSERPIETRPFAIQTIDDNRARELEFVGEGP